MAQTGYPVCFDATIRAVADINGNISGGQREFIPAWCALRQAAAYAFEVHTTDEALSDANTHDIRYLENIQSKSDHEVSLLSQWGDNVHVGANRTMRISC